MVIVVLNRVYQLATTISMVLWHRVVGGFGEHALVFTQLVPDELLDVYS